MIRRAERKDICQIAEVHVASWKTTYRGIVSDTFLDSLTSEQKVSQWTRNLEQADPILLVAVEDGKVVGFVSAGNNRSDHLPFEAEIYAIYILKEYQRKGIGKALVNAAVTEFKSRNWESMLIWALEENDSKHFYEKLGGKEAGRDQLQIEGQFHTEIAYGWAELT
ncbi:GNAT family N-acetyltransferase [Bacillus sp. Marseille-Q3570]|uniref:GNAT family N-acetyltransferase n=1 Tax=Bacillus sp. Marseille-Q3570 TaxID=2963522 RepID=UPI0021B785C7|nr:GNAT family N-acetyltransferase [Bacillus sp. Marseille-Q3570]